MTTTDNSGGSSSLLTDEMYMQRALQLATCGFGHTSPNPQVGAVIVKDGKIIGEGYHRQCGQGHAEVNAVASVADKSLLRGSTVYVTLEPCSHYGKTPPCAKLLIESGIARCVVGIEDPFPEVSGRGIAMLRAAGIRVDVGVLRSACDVINKTFFCAQRQHRPYIILKWAQSADGFIDRLRTSAQELAVQFSDIPNRTRVHRLRAEVDAILVGANTALLDHPSLTVRYWSGRQPLRICLDPHARVPSTLPFLADAESSWHIQTDCTLPELMGQLNARKVQSLLVEGGRYTLQSFIDQGLFDEMIVEEAPVSLTRGIPAPVLPSSGLQVDRKQYGRSVVSVIRPINPCIVS